MAEIKSTLEKVMEKVANMERGSSGETDSEEKIKEGMKLGADYLRGQVKEISPALAQYQEKEQAFILTGITRTLLRNIVLPRDEERDIAEKAMQGLLDLGKGSRGLIATMSDMKQVLDHYQQQKKQLHQQMESSFRQQIEQALAQQGMSDTVSANIDPVHHPKFQEEWLRVKGELNEQFGRVLDQYKTSVAQFLSAS